jgi:ketosteroid isomerase-like protein
MKKLMVIAALFVLVTSGFAQSDVRNAVDNYYAAAKNEQISTYMNSMDTSQMDAADVQATRELTLGIWEAYDTDSYSISNFKYYIDGDYALATYHMDAHISGRENVENNLEYISFLHKVGGSWKIVFVMPLAEYLESSAEMQSLKIFDDALDEQHTLYVAQPAEAEVLFDGEPMGDLGSEINSTVGTCTTDDYCGSHGLGECRNGRCTGAAEEGGGGSGSSCCGTAFILMLVPLLAIVCRD